MAAQNIEDLEDRRAAQIRGWLKTGDLSADEWEQLAEHEQMYLQLQETLEQTGVTQAGE